MTVYLPTPYPDELLYSVLARFFVRVGVGSQHLTARLLFGNFDHVDCHMPPLLGPFATHAWPGSGFQPERVLWEQTLFPFIASALEPSLRSEYGRSVLSDAGQRKARCSLAALMPLSERKATIHFCPACREEDMDRLGETYWRRTHQLPVVADCAKHGVGLAPSSTPSRSGARLGYMDATRFTRSGSVGASRRQRGHSPALGLLASNGAALLHQSRREIDARTETSLIDLLREAGLADSGRVDIPKLASDITHFYGEAIFDVVGAEGRESLSRLLIPLFRAHRLNKKPTMDWGVRSVIEGAHGVRSEPGFAGPGRRSPLVTRPEVIKRIPRNFARERFLRESAPAPSGRDVRSETSQSLPKGSGNETPSLVVVSEATARARARAKRKRERRARPQPATLTKYRERWSKALADAPHPKIKNARSSCFHVYNKLVCFDNEWMKTQNAHIRAKLPTKGPAPESTLEVRNGYRERWKRAVAAAPDPRVTSAAAANRSLSWRLLKYDREWTRSFNRAVTREDWGRPGTRDARDDARDEQMSRRLKELLATLEDRDGSPEMKANDIARAIGLASDIPATRTRDLIARHLQAAKGGFSRDRRSGMG